MISVEKREQIRRAYFVENKSMRTIAKELHCSRDTVKKAIASPEGEPYTLTKERTAPVLGPYKARIDELLAESEKMPRKQRYTGHKIYETIEPGMRKNDLVAEIYHAGITGAGGHGGDYPAIVPMLPTGADASAPSLDDSSSCCSTRTHLNDSGPPRTTLRTVWSFASMSGDGPAP